MHWITFALAGYFFNAITTIFDKFLLAGRIREPVVYAFFVSILSIFAIVLVPFGYQPIASQTVSLFVISGMFFLYGLVAFYTAVQRSEISRVAPLVGITTALIAGAASLVFGPASQISFSPGHFFSLLLLLSGAFLVAFDLPIKKHDALMPSTVLAGGFMAVSLIFLKIGYQEADFVNGLLWSRLGFILGGFSLLIIPGYRHAILSNTQGLSASNRRDVSTGLLFILNKIFGALATFCLTYAAFLGPVTFIQALNGVQYVFVFILTVPLALRFPGIFEERLDFWDWFQKGVAVLCIGLGMWLAVTQGVDFLFL